MACNVQNGMNYIVCWKETGPLETSCSSALGSQNSPESQEWEAKLQDAVEYDDLPQVRELLEGKEGSSKSADILVWDSVAVPLTSIAADRGSINMLCYLLEHGAQLNMSALE